tara:strand:+ start:197 stop:580 length:384 start_codon:yes stop_codon:yes gene_type:complete
MKNEIRKLLENKTDDVFNSILGRDYELSVNYGFFKTYSHLKKGYLLFLETPEKNHIYEVKVESVTIDIDTLYMNIKLESDELEHPVHWNSVTGHQGYSLYLTKEDVEKQLFKHLVTEYKGPSLDLPF